MSSTIDTLTNILQSAPGNWFIRMLLVQALLEDDRKSEAADLLEEEELPYDKQFLIYATRTNAMVDPVLGLEVATEATGRFPKLARAHLERGHLLMQLGEPEQAELSYATASQLEPGLAPPPPKTTGTAIEMPLPDHSGQGNSLLKSIFSNKEELSSIRKKQKANESVASLAVALTVLAVVCVGLLLVPTPFSKPRPLQIVAQTIPDNEVLKPKQIKLQNRVVKPRPAQTSSSMAINMVTATSASALSVVSFDTPSTDFGTSTTGLDFGSSMNFGGGGGGNASVMFFGSKSVGKRFLFILDASPSMTPDQIRLRDKELKKTMDTLGKASFHVILFGGGAHFVQKGWGPKRNDFYTFESPDGDYTFIQVDTGFALEEPEKFKPPKWLKPGEKEIASTIREVKRCDGLPSTDWDNALRMGHMMEPPPDVIYFMSDGLDGMLNIDKIIENNQSRGKPKINCLAMQTGNGAEQFSEISKRSKGEFMIIDKRGKPIPGDEYLADPAGFDNRF